MDEGNNPKSESTAKQDATSASSSRALSDNYVVIGPLAETDSSIIEIIREIETGQHLLAKSLKETNQDVQQRFHDAILQHGRLQHKNIVQTVDWRLSDAGQPVFITEFLEGVNLDQLIEEVGTLEDDEEITTFLIQVCDAFEYAHSEGVFHGGLTPANVVITQPDENILVKIADFGAINISRELPEHPEKLNPAYAAPERLSGLATEKSDVFSVAAVAYQLITGYLPYGSGGDGEIAAIGEYRPDIPEAEKLGFVLERALQLDPDERTSSIRDFKKGVREWFYAIADFDDDDSSGHIEAVQEETESAIGEDEDGDSVEEFEHSAEFEQFEASKSANELTAPEAADEEDEGGNDVRDDEQNEIEAEEELVETSEDERNDVHEQELIGVPANEQNEVREEQELVELRAEEQYGVQDQQQEQEQEQEPEPAAEQQIANEPVIDLTPAAARKSQDLEPISPIGIIKSAEPAPKAPGDDLDDIDELDGLDDLDDLDDFDEPPVDHPRAQPAQPADKPTPFGADIADDEFAFDDDTQSNDYPIPTPRGFAVPADLNATPGFSTPESVPASGVNTAPAASVDSVPPSGFDTAPTNDLSSAPPSGYAAAATPGTGSPPAAGFGSPTAPSTAPTSEAIEPLAQPEELSGRYSRVARLPAMQAVPGMEVSIAEPPKKPVSEAPLGYDLDREREREQIKKFKKHKKTKRRKSKLNSTMTKLMALRSTQVEQAATVSTKISETFADGKREAPKTVLLRIVASSVVLTICVILMLANLDVIKSVWIVASRNVSEMLGKKEAQPSEETIEEVIARKAKENADKGAASDSTQTASVPTGADPNQQVPRPVVPNSKHQTHLMPVHKVIDRRNVVPKYTPPVPGQNRYQGAVYPYLFTEEEAHRDPKKPRPTDSEIRTIPSKP